MTDVRSASAVRMTRRQTLILVVLLGTQFMVSVDFSVFTVALPTIGRSVGISLQHVSWISTAFALPTAGFTPLFGRVADLAGRRRVFLLGLSVLVAASLLGGLAGSATLLLGARVIQGLATAATVPAALALLVAAFPEGPLRRRALGMNGALLSAGFTIGALLGGVFTTTLSWRWAFLFNVPFAVAIMLTAARVVPESRGGDERRLDLPGAISVTLGLLALIYGIVRCGDAHWASASGWVAIVLGAALLTAFVAIEARSAQPLVPLGVLRRATVAAGNLGGLATLAMESALVFVLTIYLQRALGYSALDAGLLLGGPGIASVISGVLAPRTITRLGSPRVLILGLAVQSIVNAALLIATVPHAVIVLLLVLTVVGYFAHIQAVVSFTVTATGDLPDDEQGLATSLLTMTQQTAVTIGTPLIGTIATATAAGTAGLLGHVHLAILIDAAVTFLVAITIALTLSARHRRDRPSGRLATFPERSTVRR